MIKVFSKWLMAVVAVLSSGTAQARQEGLSGADTLEVRFRLGQSDLDLTYGNNRRDLDAFVGHVKSMDLDSSADASICIYAGASPEGPSELNRRLGEQRAVTLRRALEQRLREEGLNGLASRISTVNQGARWGGLYKLVSDSDEPWREEVLKVLRKKDRHAADWSTDPREEELRRMRKGAIWHELNTRYLPVLRSSGTAVIMREPLVVTDQVTGQRDTLVLRDTVYYVPEPIPYREAYSYQGRGWTLKTNLLPWVAATPNIQFEHTLGHKNKWSINVEAMMAWWTLSRNAYANEVIYGSVELRRWLGNRRVRNTLSGWHVGLGVGGGYYDFEWKSDGYQGEAISGFVNVGYQHRFGRYRQWLVDAGVGVGYLYSPYRKYYGSSKFPVGHEEEYDDHLMWQQTNRLNWPGVVHANISIGYVFGADKPVKYTYEEASPYLYNIRREAERKAQKEQRRQEKAAKRQARSDEKVSAKDLEARMYSMTGEQQADAKQAERQAKLERKARAKAEREARKEARRQARAKKRAEAKAQDDQDDARWQQEQQERKAEAARIAAEEKAALERQKAEQKAADEKEKAERKAATSRADADLKAKNKNNVYKVEEVK